MIRCALDHLVVVAPTLATGMAAVSEVLGAPFEKGGEHPRMGTHNALLRLGGDVYLEVIAANPGASPPGRPRWFELDDLPSMSAPRLATWVVRTDDVRGSVAASRIPLGTVEPMSRGDLEWLIAIPAEGRLVEGGVLPMVIQWTAGLHPAQRLPETGALFDRLELTHPRPALIGEALRRIGFEGSVSLREGTAPGLTAWIRTPAGLRSLAILPPGAPFA